MNKNIAFSIIAVGVSFAKLYSQQNYPSDMRSALDTTIVNSASISANTGKAASLNGYFSTNKSESNILKGGIFYNYKDEDRDYTNYPGNSNLKLNEIGSMIGYKHKSRIFDFNVTGEYQYTDFNYYGYAGIPEYNSFPSTINSSEIFSDPQNKPTQFRHHGSADIDFYLKGRFCILNAGMKASYIDDSFGLTEEGNLNAFACLNFKLSKKNSLKLAISNQWLSYGNLFKSYDNAYSIFIPYLYEDLYADNNLIRASVIYEYKSEKLALNAGIGYAAEKKQMKHDILYPVLNIDWHTSKFSNLYFNIECGLEQSTYYDLTAQNRYYMAGPVLLSQRNQIAGKAGFNFKRNGFGLNMYVRGGYTDNYASDITTVINNTTKIRFPFLDSYIDNYYTSGCNFISKGYTDTGWLNSAIAFSYEYNKWSFGLDGTFNWSDYQEGTYGKNMFEAGMMIGVNATKSLSIKADYRVLMERRAYIVNTYLYDYYNVVSTIGDISHTTYSGAETEIMRLDPVNVVNLCADYRLDKRFIITLSLNNILNQSYDITYRMPAQRFNAALGFRFEL